MDLGHIIHMLLVGFGLGLLISAPIGAVNLLCIQRTLTYGFWAGFATGVGAIIGDVLISVMAAFGITAISGFMQTHELAIQLIGGFIICGFGLKILFAHPHLLDPLKQSETLTGQAGVIPQSFLMTITNPGAILGIFAVFGSASSAIGGIANYFEALIILTGLLAATIIWWIGLAKLVARFRHKMTDRRLEAINRIAATVLIAGGFGLIIKVFLAFTLY